MTSDDGYNIIAISISCPGVHPSLMPDALHEISLGYDLLLIQRPNLK
jgi:hypothetical protein